MVSLVFNKELNGIELYFDKKPLQTIIDNLKNAGFRWHSFKKCWYAKRLNKKDMATTSGANRKPAPHRAPANKQ